MAQDVVPATPALTPRLRWTTRNAEQLARTEMWRPTASLYGSGQTFDRTGPYAVANVNGTSWTVGATNPLYLAGGMVVVAGTPITGVTFVTSTTGSTGLTHSWAVFVDQATLSVIGKSADNAAEWGVSTERTFNIAYTPATSHAMYVGLVVTVATTLPVLRGITLNAAAHPGFLPPIICGASTAGLAVPGDLGATAAAIGTGGNLAYAYLV